MRTTLQELKQLFKLDDDRQIRKGLVNKIEVLDVNHVKVKDKQVEEILRKFRSTVVMDLKEVCAHYHVQPEYLKRMMRDQVIPYFQLVSAKGSKFLFLKSDLDQINKIFLVYNKNYNRDFFVRMANKLLYNLAAEEKITTQEYAVYKMYYLDLLTVDEIEEIQKIRRYKIHTLIRRSNYKLFREIFRDREEYKKQQKFETLYYDLKRENDDLRRLLEPSPEIKKNQVNKPSKPHIPVEILLKKIWELNLSVRTVNVLRREDITTVGDLLRRKKEDLLKAQSFGQKNMSEIEKELKKLGIKDDSFSFFK